MAKRIWEFLSLTEIGDDTLFLVSDGEVTRTVPGSLINSIDARISNIIQGTATSVSAAEIIDARTAKDGTAAASLGDAIRKIETKLSQIETETFTDFDSDVVSSGTVHVVKKLGWCKVFGAATLTGAVADWTTILDNTKIPKPQHGENMFQTINSWNTSYTRPARMMLTTNGNLMVRYGAAFELNFSFVYPIV